MRERDHQESSSAGERRQGKARSKVQIRPGELTGVVAEVQKGRCLVMSQGSVLSCRLAGSLAVPSGTRLVVGDRVTFNPAEEDDGVIRELLPRATRLTRLREDRSRYTGRAQREQVLAANVDVAVIVASTTSPPFHPRLVDRYLVMCQYGQVSPVICLNKADLAESPPALEIYEAMGIPVVRASAVSGEGIEELRTLLRGKTCVLTGHSGVGKSSIINRLLGEETLEVGEVNPVMGTGRHTTTGSSLHDLGDSTYLIDTPGIRALGLWDVDGPSVRFYFPEFVEPSARCKYRDCLHVAEPECEVRDAVDRGEIPEERYESYLRLMEG